MKTLIKNALMLLLLTPVLCHASQVKTFTIYFGKDKAYISNGEVKKLAGIKWADYVRLKGHTDNDGSDAYNIDLSKKRVEAVKAFIQNLDAGIKIETDYFGERKPLNDNTNDQEKAINRRVEVTYICDPLMRLPVPAQQFEIDNSAGQVITCQHGTEIHIPAGAFDNKQVKISVSEYYEPSEILAANLSTKSDEIPIETAGMIYINAEINGKPAEPSLPIKYKFPRKNKSRDFKLFEGSRDSSNLTVNWELKKSRQADSASAGTPMRVFNPGIWPGRNEGIRSMCKATCSTNLKQELVDTILDKMSGLDALLVGGCFYNTTTDIVIDADGRISSLKTNYTDKNTECDRPLQQFIRACLPAKFEPRQKNSWLRLEIGTDKKTVLNNTQPFGFTPPAVGNGNAWMGNFGNDFITDYETDKIVLKTSQMGWINCDRFMSGIKLTNYRVQTDSGANVRLMMKKYKSFFVNEYWLDKLQPGDYRFYGIPDNEDVVLISTKKEDGTIYLAIENAKTSGKPFSGFHYKLVTQAQLEAAIKSLAI